MNKIIKYNLEIMSCIFAVMVVVGVSNWAELSALRQMTIIFMILYTLHEWEESRFPGGFYRIFFGQCTVDPNISEEKLHFPVAVYLLIILFVPFIFDNMVVFALIPLVLALFEGFIHTAGIVIHQIKKPYSPGYEMDPGNIPYCSIFRDYGNEIYEGCGNYDKGISNEYEKLYAK